MKNINKENGINYLNKTLPKIAGIGNDYQIISFDEITEETYVNYIFKAEIQIGNKRRVFYLRQTRDHVKTKPEKKLEPDRILFDVKIHLLLSKIKNGIIPEVLYLDKENNVAVLSDIKRGAPLLVKELINGRAHPQTGKYFGKILGDFHSGTVDIPHSKVRGSNEENEKAIDFHLGMRLEPALTDYPVETKQLLKESRESEHCLVMGDLASKNIFIDHNKVRFLDLERAFVWDAAFDLAFLFCHYLIEIKPEKITDSLKFIQNFMDSYLLERKFSGKKAAEFQNRVIRYLGITILYRLFGFYLVINLDRDKNRWREIAGELLMDNTSSSLYSSLKKLLKNDL